MTKKDDNVDIGYIRGLVDKISEASEEQSSTLSQLKSIAIETQLLLKTQGEQIKENKVALKEHSVRIRDVERKQDSCKAVSEVSALKTHVARLLHFKDMIMDRATEDSKVIDIHAERMKAAAEAVVSQQIPNKIWIFKTLPWMIIVFVVGVVLATMITMKALSSDGLTIPVPKVEIQTNSSSHGGKK